MIEKEFEGQIREYLTEMWGLDMNMYEGKVVVEEQQSFNIRVFFTHKKTQSVIFLDGISYMISDNNYSIGSIQLLDHMPKEQEPFFSRER